MFKRGKFRAFWLALLVVVPLALVACGGDDDDSTSAPSSDTTPTTEAAAQESEPAKLSVQLNFIQNAEHFGITWADRMGYYADENLDVTVTPGGQGIDPVAMVGAGAADIGVGDPSTIMTAVTQGIPIKVFAVEFQKAPTALTCRADRDIKEIKDIEGKKIGIKSATAQALFDQLLDHNDIDGSTLDYAPIGQTSVTEVIAGIVDCMFTSFSVNEPNSMRREGIEPVVFLIADNGIPTQGNAYFTNADTYEQNKDALARWVRATEKGWQVFLDDPDAAAKWLVDNNIVDGLDLEQQTAQSNGMVELMVTDFTDEHGLLYLNKQMWLDNAQNIFDEGRVDTLPDVDSILTFEVLDEAYKKTD